MSALNPFTIKRAQTLLKTGQLPWMDFHRQSAFGFIATAQGRGHYCRVTLRDKQLVSFRCGCSLGNMGEPCEHAVALFLKSLNFPKNPESWLDALSSFPLHAFFRALGQPLLKKKLDEIPDFKVDLKPKIQKSRYVRALFSREDHAVIRRDQREIEKVFTESMTETEEKFLAQGQPSLSLVYEKSEFYKLAKLFFFLERRHLLRARFTPMAGHDLLLELGQEKDFWFSWKIPLMSFFRAAEKQKDWWCALGFPLDFPKATEVFYRLQALPEGGLTLITGIDHDGGFLGLDHCEEVAKSATFYDPRIGYFKPALGISGLDLLMRDQKVLTLGIEEIPPFFERYRNDLSHLDPRFFDVSLETFWIQKQVEGIWVVLEQWENQRFEGKISIRFAGAWIELGDFLGAARKSDALLVMDGRYFSLQSLEGRLLQLLWHNVQKEGITPAVFFRTSSFFGSRLRLDVAEPLKEVLDEFQEMKPLDLPDLSPTGLQLRQYQEIGYAWMMFLHRVGAGGLLCDQMGLGKTHQAMALIAGMLRERPQAKILVVVPKGVFHHWVDKLDRFIPEVSVAHFIGADRDAEAALGHQVVLTTYGTLRNSRNAFFGVVFDALICDEIQALKNRHTLSHETLLQMDALSRFGLSGTPIENSLNDLKNLLDVVLPGYLGDDAFFQQGFVKPIEVDRNLEIAEMLRRLIHPFVLRRSKSEVLQELPEKVEDLLRIELSSEEHTRYQQVLREEWGSIGDGQTAMHLFQAINRLKQLCDHPALFYQKGSYDDYPCQKWDVFTEVLQEALEAEEKVVVFTQYLGMIELMKAFLEDKGIDYAWVTGQVRDRHKSIERFQSDDSCRVFLGSLGAAGVGIDLTAGSVLIHYDRWWNAAKEEQATDRLHRIGQKKTVQVFKLITANTIEDRIHQLIENKKQLLEDVVMFDDEAAVKRISMGELLDLLRP